MRLKPLHVGPDPPAVLGWCGMFARQADRIDTPWCWEQDRFKADVADPVSAQVVHLPESLAAMEAQVAQEDTIRLCPTAAILSAMDMEAVQMLVAPVKYHLEDVVKMCQSGIAAHEETAPDEGADPSEDDTQLVDAGRCTGLAHGQSVPRKTLCFKVSPRNLALSVLKCTATPRPMAFIEAWFDDVMVNASATPRAER